MKSSIPFKLTITYIVATILVITLTPLIYHQLVEFFGFQIRPNIHGFTNRVLVGSSIAALLFGYLVGRSLTRRIESVADGARRIAAGDLETHIPVRGNDELAQLGATFNEMAVRLRESLAEQKKLEQARRDLVANVAHDLRTPLAAVQAAAEALEEGIVRDEATATRYLATIGRETRYLGRLIDDLFALSQLEAGQFEFNPETLYLEDVVQDCLAGLLSQFEHQGLSLEVDLPATLPPVRADRHATRRVLANLLQNASAFTPAGECICIRGASTIDGVQVEVSDPGPGIPPEDLELGSEGVPHIFERFYRGDAARTGGGAGLGLAITRELIRAQGGRVWVESMVGQGTTLGFTLPAAE